MSYRGAENAEVSDEREDNDRAVDALIL